MFRWIGVSLLALSLLGCKNPATKEQWLTQPKKLIHAAINCQENKSKAPECLVILEAFSTFKMNLLEKQSSPMVFGERLLDLQMQFAKADTVEQRAALKDEIRRYYAVIRYHDFGSR